MQGFGPEHQVAERVKAVGRRVGGAVAPGAAGPQTHTVGCRSKIKIK